MQNALYTQILDSQAESSSMVWRVKIKRRLLDKRNNKLVHTNKHFSTFYFTLEKIWVYQRIAKKKNELKLGVQYKYIIKSGGVYLNILN